jgi:superfamily II DNA or RNA helicase
MKEDRFAVQVPNIGENEKLRKPQRDGYLAIRDYFAQPGVEREAGLILPVGCGKSGLITITPFAVKAKRALVIAPGRDIAVRLPANLDVQGLRV